MFNSFSLKILVVGIALAVPFMPAKAAERSEATVVSKSLYVSGGVPRMDLRLKDGTVQQFRGVNDRWVRLSTPVRRAATPSVQPAVRATPVVTRKVRPAAMSSADTRRMAATRAIATGAMHAAFDATFAEL
jgi:hypothetical protein